MIQKLNVIKKLFEDVKGFIDRTIEEACSSNQDTKLFLDFNDICFERQDSETDFLPRLIALITQIRKDYLSYISFVIGLNSSNFNYPVTSLYERNTFEIADRISEANWYNFNLDLNIPAIINY